MKHIVMLSYGKDSTVMLDQMIRNNYKIDHIIFCDTLWEFDELHEYKKNYDNYLRERYGLEVITLKPESTFEDWIYGKMKTGDRIGQIRGVPMATIPCYWKREAKQKPAEKWAKQNYPKQEVMFYMGFAKDEDREVKETKYFKYRYPLKELGFTERDCLVYLQEHEMENELYRKFLRLGCKNCPYQSEASWKQIYDYYPEVWQWVKDTEKKLHDLDSSGETVANKYFFMGHKTTGDMEFKFKHTADGLFDISDEPLKNCFCFGG